MATVGSVAARRASGLSAQVLAAQSPSPSATASSRMLHENPRLRVFDWRAGAAGDVYVTHAVPTVRWLVLSGADPTPSPEFFAAGSSANRRGGSRELVFEILGEPRYSEEEVRSVLAAPAWPTDVGSTLMLQNRYVRMWDFRSSKGMNKHDFHQHCLDNAFVVIGEGHLNVYSPSDLKDPGAAKAVFQRAVHFSDGEVSWHSVEHGGYESDGVTPIASANLHSVDNISSAEFREYLIELK